jgi:hypothetical protein
LRADWNPWDSIGDFIGRFAPAFPSASIPPWSEGAGRGMIDTILHILSKDRGEKPVKKAKIR